MARRRTSGRRRRGSARRVWIVGLLATAAGIWAYGNFVSPVLEGEPAARLAAGGPEAEHLAPRQPRGGPRLISSRPEVSDGGAGRHVTEKGENDALTSTLPVDPEKAKQAESLYTAGLRDIQNGDLLAARAHLSDAVDLGLDDERLLEARAALARIGTQTIFSTAIVNGDPFVSRVNIQPGETLGKIAKRYNVTDDFLAAINGIQDKNRIRAGQAIKVVQGPFHAKIDKQTYSMDLYLQNTFVRHYSVGLGADNSTPSGVWKVGTKLVNPTYYPPRGGAIVAADDPENPLGERWIEMVGVGGDAVGQLRYGIHGTIDPDSIGRNESLGCIRLHNADVEEVYILLVPEKSQITVE